MKKEIFKINAIVEQDPLNDNLMSMVMGGAGGGSGCNPKQTHCSDAACLLQCPRFIQL